MEIGQIVIGKWALHFLKRLLPIESNKRYISWQNLSDDSRNIVCKIFEADPAI